MPPILSDTATHPAGPTPNSYSKFLASYLFRHTAQVRQADKRTCLMVKVPHE